MTVLSRIEGQGCGCDGLAGQNGLVSIDEALALIAGNASPVGEVEEVALVAARGRVLAEPLRARSAVPPFDNAAMDGYAIDTGGLNGEGPWQLPVAARIAAGQTLPDPLRRGTAARIFTGAPIPEGADAVVMQEDVQRSGDAITITQKVGAGGHIRVLGEDMAAGQTVVPAGRHLTARDIAACAAAGARRVAVRRALRVALLVTGDEVITAGRPRNSAAIRDVNTPMLSAALAMPGVELIHVGAGRDDRGALRRQLGDLFRMADLIVTTGGISVGEEDHVKPALSDLGVGMVFSGVAMKPGKPVSYGRLGQAHWLGLPGNPLSAFVTWQLFGTALCSTLAGGTRQSGARRHVLLSRQLHHRPGRCELRLAVLSGFDGTGREVADFADATHSGRVAALPAADGVILIPAEAETLPEGALVEFQAFHD